MHPGNIFFAFEHVLLGTHIFNIYLFHNVLSPLHSTLYITTTDLHASVVK